MNIRLSLILFLNIFLIGLYAQETNPIADAKAMVVQGYARFTVLTDMLIRMEYSDSAKFIDKASLTFVNRHLPVPEYQVSHQNGWLFITTHFMVLKYKENSGAFNRHNLEVTISSYFPGKEEGGNVTWKPGMKDSKNLKGTTRTLDGAMGKFSFMSMKKLKLDDGILSRSGWTLVDDSGKPLFDNSEWPWVEENNSGNRDWYFFGYGSNYKRALFDYVSVAGKISMPPRFAFGIWYSRYWKYTEQDMKDIVNEYEKNDMPLDVLVVDMDWHLTEHSSPQVFEQFHPKPNGWTGFTWEKKYFPDYREFLKWTDDKKLQTCLNIHPAAGVQAQEEAYPAFAKAMGVDTTGRPAIPFDITNKTFAKNYFDILLHPYEKQGVDFWWLDWQQWGGTHIKGVNPTFYLNYVHYSDMQRQGKRPLIFHRYGGLGNQRYQIGFSGDYIINWKSLAYQPEFTANASNVGFGYWSHDIGGHMNPVSVKDKQNPELFTRWVQWGAMSPVFRTHATADPGIERRMYKYPEPYFKAMRKAIQFRYSLLPYIYTYSRLAYDSGISLIRPMYYDYPGMDKAYRLNHQYFFGNDLIVAPVTQSMQGKESITQSVWLPEGAWYDQRNNTLYNGGKFVNAIYTLDEIPVFIKAGSIIPSQMAKLRITGSVLDTVVLTVYPAKQGSFKMYEDDGTTENYKKGIYSFTAFAFEQSGKEMKLTITPDGKQFEGQVIERSYLIHIVASSKPTQVNANGRACTEGKEWSYNEVQKIISVQTPKQVLANVVVTLNQP